MKNKLQDIAKLVAGLKKKFVSTILRVWGATFTGNQKPKATKPNIIECVCPYCNTKAEVVGGQEIYPHRPDLFKKKFWFCRPCDAYVGCHEEKYCGKNGTKPLGTLANKKLRRLRSQVHRHLDPLWRDGIEFSNRKEAYGWLAKMMEIDKKECHIAKFDEVMCLEALVYLEEFEK